MLRLSVSARKDSGDTLIEVLFAMMIFSLILVSSLTLMNQGIAASQRALSITSVRQQMDGQAETLRFLQESYVDAYESGTSSYPAGTPAAEYYKIIQRASSGSGYRASASEFGGTGMCQIPDNPSKDFILNPVLASVETTSTKPGVFQVAPTFAQVTYTSGDVLDKSQGIWIEAVRSGLTTPSSGFIDFHIRACWDVPGSNIPMNLGTIVRLYEPRG